MLHVSQWCFFFFNRKVRLVSRPPYVTVKLSYPWLYYLAGGGGGPQEGVPPALCHQLHLPQQEEDWLCQVLLRLWSFHGKAHVHPVSVSLHLLASSHRVLLLLQVSIWSP